MVPQIAEEWEKWRKVSGRKWAVTSNKSDGTKILEHVGNVWKYDSKEDVAHQWISDIVFNESWFFHECSAQKVHPHDHQLFPAKIPAPYPPKKTEESWTCQLAVFLVSPMSALWILPQVPAPKKDAPNSLELDTDDVEGISSPSLTLNR